MDNLAVNPIIDHYLNTSADIKTAVRKCLHDGPTKIVFTKVDGTVREMICTLNADILEEHDALPKESKDGSKRKVNEAVIRVYDLEKKDWRSFRVDNLYSCSPYELLSPIKDHSLAE